MARDNGPTTSKGTWRNWDRSLTCSPQAVVTPRDEGVLRRVLADANGRGLPVRVVGSGCSSSPLAVTDGVHVRMSHFSGIQSVDPARRHVTVGAGTLMSELGPQLARHGLAMPSLGDSDGQTVAGAIATGTHGTGLGYRSYSAQVRRLRLMLADGSVLDCSAGQHGEIFRAARLGLGTLGIVTAVTLKAVPAFVLHRVEQTESLADVLDTFTHRARVNPHFSFYWFPRTELALTKQSHHLPADTARTPRTTVQSFWMDEIVANGAFATACRVGSSVAPVRRLANQVGARTITRREDVDVSYRQFVSNRPVRYREVEYGLPLRSFVMAFEDIRRIVNAQPHPPSIPVEVRVADAEPVWLSPAYRRPTVYISVRSYYRDDPGRLFAEAEAVLRGYDGRPHWGKYHTMRAADLASRYPRFADFRRARDQADPGGLFTTPYLRELLG